MKASSDRKFNNQLKFNGYFDQDIVTWKVVFECYHWMLDIHLFLEQENRFIRIKFARIGHVLQELQVGYIKLVCTQNRRPSFNLIFMWWATDERSMWLLFVCDKCSLNRVLIDLWVCPIYISTVSCVILNFVNSIGLVSFDDPSFCVSSYSELGHSIWMSLRLKTLPILLIMPV
jgi:hypothetical protein